MVYTFGLDDEEAERYDKWLAAHDEACRYSAPGSTGAIGGRMTFSFTGTSLGVVVKVKCACGEVVDLTDYLSW